MIGKLTTEQIEELLLRNIVGRIGCCDGKQPYIIPTNYIYDGKYIIGHAVAGKKISLMRNNPSVCFEVEELKNLTNWKTVIAFGQYQEITDEHERYLAMKLFVDRIIRLKVSDSALPPELMNDRVHPRSPGNIKPVIYRILLAEKTGRFESSGSSS